MVAGFDRYFQIAPCFRDEASRADRAPGEFYQLDFEMSFVTQDDVFAAIEPVLHGVFEEFGGGRAVTPAAVPAHHLCRAALRYGTDKPDLQQPARHRRCVGRCSPARNSGPSGASSRPAAVGQGDPGARVGIAAALVLSGQAGRLGARPRWARRGSATSSSNAANRRRRAGRPRPDREQSRPGGDRQDRRAGRGRWRRCRFLRGRPKGRGGEARGRRRAPASAASSA